MGGKYKYSPEVYRDIADKYVNGDTCCALAKKYNLSEIQITRIVREQGFEMRTMSEAKKGRPNYAKRCFDVKTERKIMDLYISGLHQDVLARRFGCNKNTIHYLLKRQNCPIKGHIGKHHPNYVGGVYYDGKGHRMLYKPGYPGAHRGSIYEHRYIMQEHLGRRLQPTEIIHHINGIPDDNRIENLQIMTASEHSKLHNGRRFN